MDALICQVCGGELRRSRRKLLERIGYVEAYRCKECQARVRVSVYSRMKDWRYAGCPKCGSAELTVLKRVDKVDRMRRGPTNFLRRMLGGKLYHCWLCRLQFYDLRPRKPLPGDGRGDTAKSAATVWPHV